MLTHHIKSKLLIFLHRSIFIVCVDFLIRLKLCRMIMEKQEIPLFWILAKNRQICLKFTPMGQNSEKRCGISTYCSLFHIIIHRIWQLSTILTNIWRLLWIGHKLLGLKTCQGTVHLRRRQIFMIFDPYPPTIGIPTKCLWRVFWSLCTVTFQPSAHGDTPPPLRYSDVLNGWSLIHK